MIRAELSEEVHEVIGVSGRNPTTTSAARFECIIRGRLTGENVETGGFRSFHTRQREGLIERNNTGGTRAARESGLGLNAAAKK